METGQITVSQFNNREVKSHALEITIIIQQFEWIILYEMPTKGEI